MLKQTSKNKQTTYHATDLSCGCTLPAVNLLFSRNLTWSLITRKTIF